MDISEIIIIAVSLAVDAFAVSVCFGLSLNKINIKKGVIVGTYFGIFQAIMPFFGYLFGNLFKDMIINYDHWIIFVLLNIIGLNMIIESFNKENTSIDDTSFKNMLMYSLATSIDALSVGITFSFLKVNIITSCILIGIITYMLSFIGVIIGSKFGTKYDKISTIIGGLFLIILGIKILLEHLGIL